MKWKLSINSFNFLYTYHLISLFLFSITYFGVHWTVVGLYFLPLSTVAYYTHGSSLADKENIFQIVVEGVDRTISLALITLHVISAFIIYGNPLFQEIEELIGIPLREVLFIQ